MTTLTTAHQVRHALKRRFERVTRSRIFPEHVLAFEVPIDGRPRFDGIDGWRSRQRIDAVAVGMTKSSEHLVHGFEIKVSRSDLLHELRDPSKAEAAVRAVDRWWLVLGDPRLLRDGDPLPEGWGVLAPRGRGLATIVDAAPQAGEIDRRVLAGIVQAAMRSHTACRGLAYADGWNAALRTMTRRGRLS